MCEDRHTKGLDDGVWGSVCECVCVCVCVCVCKHTHIDLMVLSDDLNSAPRQQYDETLSLVTMSFREVPVINQYTLCTDAASSTD